jgi:hypothetical protein
MRKTAGPISSSRAGKIRSAALFSACGLICILNLAACSHTRPSVELVLAREAFNAAKEVESARYAPGFYHKAEEAYRAGLQLYADREYSGAVDEFRAARYNAERAENSARIQRQKSGDEGI